MKEVVLTPGQFFENDTVYRADRALYDVYEKDCAEVNNPWCIPGVVYPAAVYAENLDNIVMDFGGATLRLNGYLQPVTLYQCRNVKICNVNIEYDRGIYSEAEVLKVTEDYARVHFSDKFPCRVENGRLIPYARFWEDDHLFERQMFFQFFDAATGDGVGLSLGIVGPELPAGQDLCFQPVQYIAKAAGEDVIFCPAKPGEKMPEAWREGSVLAIEHGGRVYSGVILQSCRNVTLENVRLINTNGMGILPLHCENLYIRGLRMQRDEKSHGVITNSADGIHGISNAGDFIIEDSVIEGTMDDALNIHGQFQKVVRCEGNRLTVKLVTRELTQYANLIDAGDEIGIHRENTMVWRSKHRVLERKLLDEKTMELTLDTPPRDARAEDLVENLTGNCQLLIRRCRFAKTNTHLRFQTRGKIVIEDCITELPFWFTGDADFWYESSPCRDVTIRNTYFVKPEADICASPEVHPCSEEPYYHKHITVESCMFVTSTPLTMRYTDDIRFVANRNSLNQPMEIRLTDCGTVFAPGVEMREERLG